MSRPDADERLREAFRSEAGDDRGGQPSASCPDDATVWAASRGELSPERTTSLLDHSVGCPRCAESFRAAATMIEELEATRSTPGGGVAGARSRRGLGFVGLAAAAVLAAVLLPVALRDDEPVSPPDAYREPDGALAIRSEVDEAVPLPRDAFVLRWSGAPDGSRYTVELATEELDVIHRAPELDVPEYRVPGSALANLPAGAVVLWRVEAMVPGGGRVESPVFRGTVE